MRSDCICCLVAVFLGPPVAFVLAAYWLLCVQPWM